MVVAMAIVDLFEIVQIHNGEGMSAEVGLDPLQLQPFLEPVHDVAPVWHPGQRIWAHARRYFERANDYQDSKFARSVLRAIRSVYDQEKKLWHTPAQHRLEERQRLISPMLKALKTDLEDAAHVADGRLNTAINYMLTRWNTLCSFLYDGRLEIDNNFIENVIRGLVITRKNSLFIGNEDAGEAWAIFYTLIETCKLNKIDPRSYFAWVTEHMEVTEGKVDPATLVPWLCPHGRFA